MRTTKILAKVGRTEDQSAENCLVLKYIIGLGDLLFIHS